MLCLTILVLSTVSASAALSSTSVPPSHDICRFVCPDLGDGSVLSEEVLVQDGSIGDCVWFSDAFGTHIAGYDLNGVPTFQFPNNHFTSRAAQLCVTTADGWSWAQGQVCVTDPVNPRILAGDTTVQVVPNSPAACTSACDALGFTFSGVEFGSECHCGTGFNEKTTPVVHTHCNMPCLGESTATCGGAGSIAVFAGPNPPRAAILPAGWSVFAPAPCAQDSAARMFVETLIAGPKLAATDTPAACVGFCIANNLTMAGVEGGDECYCGTAFRDKPVALDPARCDLPCQGARGITCGGNFAIQLYTSV